MASPSPEHQAMAEAFVQRLRRLFPEATYAEGKVHQHAERHVSDHWILWDSLRPKAGPEGSLAQGVIPSFLDDQVVYPRTSTQQALLQMQTSNVRHLYSFSTGLSFPQMQSLVFQAMTVGLDIYCFTGWDGEESFPAEYGFVSIADLRFAENGLPFAPPSNDDQLKRLAASLGLDVQQLFVPAERLARLNQLFSTPDGLQEIARAGLAESALSAFPSSDTETAGFLKSGGLERLQKFLQEYSGIDHQSAFQDSDHLAQLADTASRLKSKLEAFDMPPALKRWLLPFIDPDGIATVADMMQLLERSEAFRKGRLASSPQSSPDGSGA